MNKADEAGREGGPPREQVHAAPAAGVMGGLLAALADVARYYWYLGYYLLFGFSRFPTGSHDMYLWSLAIMLRCQNGESPWFHGRSIVAHELLLALQDRYRPTSRLALGVFQVLLPIGLALYPLFVAVWLPLATGSFRASWFRRMLRDVFTGATVIWTSPATSKADLLDRWCAVDRYTTGYHHGAIHVLLYNRHPELNGFREEYEREDKRALAEACRLHGIPHPPTLHVTWHPRAEPASGGAPSRRTIVKPVLGWSGFSILDAGHDGIFFPPSEEVAEDYVARHPDFIAQRCVRNVPEIARLWGDAQALGAFRMYTGRLDGEIAVLSSCWLRFPNPVTGLTDLDAQSYLYVNVDAALDEVGRIEEYYEDFGDALGTSIDATGERWDFMPELMKLAVDAHRAIMPGLDFVAWDVAMTTDGPMLIEVNVFNDINPFTLHGARRKFAAQTYDLFFAALQPLEAEIAGSRKARGAGTRR